MSIVTGVFRTIEGAEDTVKALLDAGFSDDDIGVVVRDTQKGTTIADDIGREYASGATPHETTVMSRTSVWDRFPEGYVDVMRRENLPDDAVNWYFKRYDEGDVLMVVDAHDRPDDVMRIMRDHTGDIYHGGRAPRETMTHEKAAMEHHFPVIEEEVAMEKVRREVGEAHVVSETRRESVDIPTVVTHEQIRVERRRLESPVSPDEYQGRKAGQEELCMPIVEEEIRVVKRPVIREELVITRIPVTEQQTVRETVQRTEPRVEKTGKVDIHEEKRRKRGEAA